MHATGRRTASASQDTGSSCWWRGDPKPKAHRVLLAVCLWNWPHNSKGHSFGNGMLLSSYASMQTSQSFSPLWSVVLQPTCSLVLASSQGIENKRTRELSEDELTRLRDEVDKYTIEGDLRRFNALNIKRLKEIQCYRGRRHIAVGILSSCAPEIPAQTWQHAPFPLSLRKVSDSLVWLCSNSLYVDRGQRTMRAHARARQSQLLERRSRWRAHGLERCILFSPELCLHVGNFI